MAELKDLTKALQKNSPKVFFSTLFEVSNAVKHAHLTAVGKKFSTHEALGEFYDKFNGQLDRFIETYFGKYGVKEFEIPGCKVNDIVSFLRNRVSYFESCYDIFKEGFLQNQLDAIIEECYQLIYKLENLNG